MVELSMSTRNTKETTLLSSKGEVSYPIANEA